MTQQLTIGRVYTCDLALNELYIQHYKVIVEPIESYCLKNTRHNLNAKSSKKYSSTMATYAIIKCQECHLHADQHLVDANQRAYRNNRSSPSCIFKQSANLAKLLPVKSHQPYQDIILIKQNLADLLPLYELHTNINFSSPQASVNLGTAFN